MPSNPFKFLDSYEKEDEASFFGRSKETAQLYNAVHASNLVLIYGASGTGKTSLVNCGLANKFQESDWLPLFVRRNDDLNRSLSSAVNGAFKNPDEADEGADLQARIRSLYLDHYRPIYLIFDQFEELYILGSPQEQEQFHQTASQLLQAGLQCKVLLIIREEYLAYLSEFERVVPPLFDNRLRIEKMNDTNLKRVVLGITQYGGIHVEQPRETISQIIENLRDKREGVELTNLQVYLDQLWRRDVERQSARGVADPQPTFDQALVAELGRFENVLSDFLDEQLGVIDADLGRQGVTPAQGTSLEVLFALVTEDGTKRNMDSAAIAEAMPRNRKLTPAQVEFCLDELSKIRLLRRLSEEG